MECEVRCQKETQLLHHGGNRANSREGRNADFRCSAIERLNRGRQRTGWSRARQRESGHLQWLGDLIRPEFRHL